MEDIFNALRYTPYHEVKAVILGQDPYHGPGQAHGLCFSVQPGVQPPPSLLNIFQELQSDLGITPPAGGTLTKWAERGVLLLNTTLTVRRGQANSHRNIGWTTFTAVSYTHLPLAIRSPCAGGDTACRFGAKKQKRLCWRRADERG